MINNFDIKYDSNKDVLNLVKLPHNNVVDHKEGKYGIRLHKDIYNNVVCIEIPEPNILFGFNLAEIQNFIYK